MLELKNPNEKQRKLISHSVCKCHIAATQQTVGFGVKRTSNLSAGPARMLAPSTHERVCAG